MDYKKFYDLSFDMMCIIGPTRFLSVNKKFPKHLGYTSDELLAHPWAEYVHPDDLHGEETLYTEGGSRICRFRTSDGRYVWLEWSGSKAEDGQVYLVCRDISARKQVETQLAQHVETLKRSNDELEQFAYAASHDLQEPLRTISSYAQIIQEDFVGEIPAEMRENLSYIVDAAKQGRSLINDLLELSRVGRTTAFDWVSLNTIVDQAVVGVEFQVRETSAIVVRDNLPLIWGDAAALTFLFRNLLSNALKFGKEGLPPTVSIGGEEENAAWHIWVRDDGIGIEPRFATQIFSVFKRLDNTRPGTGIGLSICRKVVDLHGGRIWVESELGAGATFHIYFPRSDNHAFPPPQHPSGRGPSPRREDDPSSLQQTPNETRADFGQQRSGGPALLAAGGGLRDRPTPRNGTLRPQSAKGYGL